MSETLDDDLYQRTKRLLEPGDIELNGAVVHTDLEGNEDVKMHQASIDVGEIIASYATDEETFVYSGTNDSDFSSNQHQGLTLEGEEFVWECQQLLRNGTFDIVFYYEAHADHDAILEDIRDAGFEVTGVRGD